MVKNDKIEFRCSSELRTDFEVLIAELSPKLRRKLGRRIYTDDVFMLIMNILKKQPWLLEQELIAKASIK